MERALLDTDIFSEVLRGRNQAVVAKADAYLATFGKFTVSVITVAEMVEGLKWKGRQDAIDRLLSKLRSEQHEILPLNTQAATIAGSIAGDLNRLGQSIGRVDPFIAAIAIEAGLPLVTGNIGHFERVSAMGYALHLIIGDESGRHY